MTRCEEGFRDWVQAAFERTEGQVVPVDGKRVRGSHDLTLKSLFAERDMARDLIRHHAALLFPELGDFEPADLAATATVTTNPAAAPHQQARDRDLVWTLVRAADTADRALLHLEFQSQPDAAMTRRMFEYAHGLFPHYPDCEVYGLVVNTGPRPFGR